MPHRRRMPRRYSRRIATVSIVFPLHCAWNAGLRRGTARRSPAVWNPRGSRAGRVPTSRDAQLPSSSRHGNDMSRFDFRSAFSIDVAGSSPRPGSPWQATPAAARSPAIRSFVRRAATAMFALAFAASAAASDRILLNAEAIDTGSSYAQTQRASAVLGSFTGKRLHLVQFTGPVRQQWVDSLAADGLRSRQLHSRQCVPGLGRCGGHRAVAGARPHRRFVGAMGRGLEGRVQGASCRLGQREGSEPPPGGAHRGHRPLQPAAGRR